MTLVLADTSAWARIEAASEGESLAALVDEDRLATVLPVTLELLRSARDAKHLREAAARYDALQQIPVSATVAGRARVIQRALAARGYHRGPSPTDLVAAAAAELTGAELWHCDRHFELIGEVTGQPMRRVGE